MDELDSESWLVRETFAYFGRAMYMASVLEVGLAHVLMAGQFLKATKEKLIGANGQFDQEKYEADFDQFMDDQFKQTMGNLIKRVNEFANFDDGLKGRIQKAKERRDFLAHNYWREYGEKFCTASGKEEMAEELNADAEMFLQLDRDIYAATAEMRKNVGMNDSLIEKYVEKWFAKLQDDREAKDA